MLVSDKLLSTSSQTVSICQRSKVYISWTVKKERESSVSAKLRESILYGFRLFVRLLEA